MLVLNYFLSFFILTVPTLYFVYLLLEIKKDLKKSLLYVLALFLLSAVLLNKLLLFPVTLAQKDFNNIQIPMFQFFHDSISRYFLPPIWNSSFSGGFDAFSSPLSSYFSVFNWVFLIGSNVYKSFSFFIFLQVFLCALFSFYMLKTFKLSGVSSFLGAVLFTFNGYVIMRLSQGVGIEYLYAYKWLPLILAFSKKFLDTRNLKYFLCLAISFSLSFEGSINQVVASGVMLLIYLVSEYKRLSGALKYFIFLVPSVFILYAVKLVPFIELVLSGVSRFSSRTGGWRQGNIDWNMFPEILLPVKFNFSNAVFTPGLLGILLFAGGLAAAVVFLIKQKKAPFEGFIFALASIILSVVLTVENPLYFLFYSLPVLNQTTQIPSFLIFYIIPIVFFGAFAIEKLNKLMPKTQSPKLLLSLLLPLTPLAVYLEVLMGPSTFGNDTYSFNFSKMEIAESIAFPHYNLMSFQPAGLFVFYGNGEENIFFYPYGISSTNLKTLNGYYYFFGSLSGQDLLGSGLDEIKKRVDYVMTLEPLREPDLTYVGKVSMSALNKFKSQAVFENQGDYLSLYSTGWNDDVFIYKTNCLRECSVKNLSDNPIKFEVNMNASTGSEIVSTSIAFSPWLKARSGNRTVPLYKDNLGYVSMDSNDLPKSQSVVSFTYINPYIYAGVALSMAGFICMSVLIFRKNFKQVP